MPGLRGVVTDLVDGDESAAVLASAIEFVLEGLHLSKRLNKDSTAGKAIYRAKVG
jgi:magnesium chelatase subunit I